MAKHFKVDLEKLKSSITADLVERILQKLYASDHGDTELRNIDMIFSEFLNEVDLYGFDFYIALWMHTRTFQLLGVTVDISYEIDDPQKPKEIEYVISISNGNKYKYSWTYALPY